MIHIDINISPIGYRVKIFMPVQAVTKTRTGLGLNILTHMCLLIMQFFYHVTTILFSLFNTPLFLNDTIIPKTSTAQVLGFTFDSLLTWESYVKSWKTVNQLT